MESDIRIPNEQGDLGKYDGECAGMCRALRAQGAALIVVDGLKGSGFSISVSNPAMLPTMANLFEKVAHDIRMSLKSSEGN